MSTDDERKARQRRAHDAQERALRSASPDVPDSAKKLWGQIYKSLKAAYDDDRALQNPQHEIEARLKFSDDQREILGGEKDPGRTREKLHFTRKDGAWFDFAITYTPSGDPTMRLHAYNFEIRFPGCTPPWVRFDLNEPGHKNDERERRAHLHPGSDDYSVPSAVLTPLEILDVFIYGMKRTRTKPRTKGTTPSEEGGDAGASDSAAPAS